MKKLLVTLTALTAMASAEYTTFTSQSREIGSPVKVEEIYFGEDYKFSEVMKDKDASMLIGGTAAGVTAGATVLGGATLATAGLVGGTFILVMALDGPIKRSKMDQKYLLVNRITDAKGNVAFKRTLFVGSNGSDYTPDQIRTFIKGGK